MIDRCQRIEQKMGLELCVHCGHLGFGNLTPELLSLRGLGRHTGLCFGAQSTRVGDFDDDRSNDPQECEIR